MIYLTFIYPVIEPLVFLLLSAVALGCYKCSVAIKKLRLKSERETELQLNELGFLRNQFNSHITFNFLNYCYNKTHKASQRTAEGIELFSKMLRYSINCRTVDRVLLSAEINHIENFINLHKLMSEQVSIEFLMHNIKNDSIQIAPGILIAMVENAFENGNKQTTTKEVKITIELLDNCIYFSVIKEKNANTTRTANSTRVEQNNFRRQLEFLCKNKFTLNIEEKNNTYATNLKLILT